MMTDSEMLEKDKKEFEKASEKEPYKSPFPKDTNHLFTGYRKINYNYSKRNIISKEKVLS